MWVCGFLFLFHTALMIFLFLNSWFSYSVVVHPHSLQLPILIAGPLSLVLFVLFFLLRLFTSNKRFWIKLVAYSLPLVCLAVGILYGALMYVYHKSHPPVEELRMVYCCPDNPDARLVSIREASGRQDRYLLIKQEWGVFRFTRVITDYTRQRWESDTPDEERSELKTDDDIYMIKMGK